MSELRLTADHVVTASGVLENAVVVIRDGRFIEVVGAAAAGVGQVERISGWLVPGFVDTHCHGGGGADYAGTDLEQIRRGIAFHRRHGTTTTLASLVTADLDTLGAQVATLAPLVSAGEIAGVHLEGPFLSPLHPGAHTRHLLREPDPELVDRVLELGRGCIRMVTLAPELPGGLAAVERLRAAGVVAAFGHTDADEQVLGSALDAGASVATHLFNAMRPIHHREPGPIPRLLTDRRAALELICDGFHMHPDVISLAVAAAGPERIMLVTDAMLAAGMPDGDFSLGGLAVRVTQGQARLVTEDGSPGTIAGSTLTMGAAFELVVGLGVSVADASLMAATTPARRHGLDAVGAIEVGRRADLCVVDDRGRLQRVLRAGEWVPA